MCVSLTAYFIQINCQKSRIATVELFRQKFEIALITEPCKRGNNLAYVDRNDYNIFAGKTSPRAAIAITRRINAWELNEYTDGDMVTVSVKLDGKEWIVCSLYLDIKMYAEKELFSKLITHANNNSIPLIVGSDSNSHSTAWGSDTENERGRILEDLLNRNNLFVINDGDIPTFVTSRAKSVIDITIINEPALSTNTTIKEWRVDTEKNSMSDHRYIRYTVGSYAPEKESYRNYKRMNWESFEKALSRNEIPDNHDLDKQALDLQNKIQTALDEGCPLTQGINKRPNKWWNSSLENKRKELDQTKGELHRSIRKEYSKMIKKAKRESWRAFCTEASSTTDISRLVKILDGKARKGNFSTLINSHNQNLNARDSLVELMNTHFPENEIINEDKELLTPQNQNNNMDTGLLSYIDEHKVQESINSFGPKKSAGPDGIKPLILQRLNKDTIKEVVKIFRKVIITGYTPAIWRDMKVIFLPKPGKDNYAIAKAYRPITLSNFLLKSLERIIQWYINDFYVQKPLIAQHAYTRGRSTETALSDFVDHVEKAINQGQKLLAVSLDCSGAFDRIKFDSAETAMREHNIPETVITWYDNLLKNRKISAELLGEKITIKPTKGSPQGGILSPLVWNLIMDTLLTELQGDPIRVIGYADDILLFTYGKDSVILGEIMQNALNKVNNWGNKHGLVFNPDKTSTVLFTKSRRWKEFEPKLKLSGKNLKYGESLIYLGLTIQKRLKWSEHIRKRIKMCNILLKKSRSVVGREWGLSPYKLIWIYTTIIRPKLCYGCLVWGHNMTSLVKNELIRLQRKITAMITRCLRSTPNKTLDNILGLVPLELFIEGESMKARVRTRYHNDNKWDGINLKGKAVGHRRCLDDELERIIPEDYPTDKIIKVNNWYCNPVIENADTIIFTDGSKNEKANAGYGWAATEGDILIKENNGGLGKATVFQAELVAIQSALLWLISNPPRLKGKKCLIKSDSQSAIAAIISREIKSKLVSDIVKLLARVNQQGEVGIAWIKGHSNDTGNEYADYLAKEGCEYEIQAAEPIITETYSSVKNKINDYISQCWQRLWDACDHKQSKCMLPKIDMGSHKKVRKMSSNNLSTLAKAISGHGLFAGHLWHWKEGINILCKKCQEGPETFWHLWNTCPAMERLRQNKNARFITNNNSNESENEYKRENLFSDIIFYYNSPPLQDLIEENEAAILRDNPDFHSGEGGWAIGNDNPDNDSSGEE